MENQEKVMVPKAELSKSNTMKKILFVLLGIAVIAGAVYAGMMIAKNQTPTQKTSEASIVSPTPTEVCPSPTTCAVTQWKTAKFGGVFSYEYPYGWNVAEVWQDNPLKNGIYIAIDPNPINLAPRGGPLSTFEILIINGNNNPDEILAEKMKSFNSTNYSDITQEVINADIGKIYHFTGKFNTEMMRGLPIESYYFTFNQNPKDVINQIVAKASMSLKDDPQLSAMLRHIVLSIKTLKH